MRKALITAVAVLLVIAVVVMNIDSFDYNKAYNKTQKLRSFEVNLSTIIDISEPEGHRQSVIDQVLSVENYGKSSMVYTVTANSTSTDDGGKVLTEESEYTYYKDEYYLSLPGVKYKSFCGFDAAKSNITNLVNALSFPYDKMYNVTKTRQKGQMLYEFDVEYSDVSNHVITALQSAVNNFEGTNFRVAGVSAEAIVKDGYVSERGLWVVYESDTGVEIAMEVRWKLNKKKCSVEKPDASKYASL